MRSNHPPEAELSELTAILASIPNAESAVQAVAQYVERSPVGLALYAPDGRPLHVTPSLRGLLAGLSAPGYRLLADELLQEKGLLGLVERAFRGELVSVPAIWHESSEERRRALALTLIPITNGAGELSLMVGVFLDQSDALSLREAQLTEQQRLQSLLTEHQTALSRLRESENNLAAAQRLARMGSWELDLGDLGDVNANPLRWSDEVFRLFGYEPGEIEVTNENFFRAVHPDDREQIGEAVRRALDTGTEYSVDHRIILPDGSERIVHEQSAIVRDPVTGRPIRMVGTVHDITERVLAEHSRARAAELDRLASMGTLAAGVAHEINNPLAALTGNLELAMRAAVIATGSVEPNELTLALTEARAAAERVRLIVRDMRVLSRAEDDQRGPVDVCQVLKSALRLAAGEIRARARLSSKLDPVPLALANESRLGQVFLNLLINAAQAIPEGKVESNEIRVATRFEPDGCVAIEVTDTGVGMNDEVKRKLFTPFFTTKPIGQGTGLGLSISHSIVSALGGTIEVSSEPGRGASFVVRLPPAEPIMAAELKAAALPTARARVLVIDDEPGIGLTLGKLLRSYDVSAECDPAAALARLRAGERFDVILCDLMMPQSTGMDLHKTLVDELPELAQRMIFMTGGAFTVEARDFLQRVKNPRIEKPFELIALDALITSIAAS